MATQAPETADQVGGRHVREMKEQLNKQVGGDHYKRLAVQPMESNIRNRTPWAEGEIIKYVGRWEAKNGVQDLEKAAHILDALIAYAESDEYKQRYDRRARDKMIIQAVEEPHE